MPYLNIYGSYLEIAGGQSLTGIGYSYLQLYLPDDQTNLRYSVISSGDPGELLTSLPRVSITAAEYASALTRGPSDVQKDVFGSESSFTTHIGRVDWGNDLSSVVLQFQQDDGFQSKNHFFALSGDPLPGFSTLNIDAFIASITYAGPASGSDGDGAAFDLSDVPSVLARDLPPEYVLVDRTGETSGEQLFGSNLDDRISGGGGNDTILGGQGDDFIYGDGIQANLTGDVAGQVFRMYKATLDRAPDATGYEGWVADLFDGRVALTDFPNGFVNSREFQNTYGALDDAGFVKLLYNNVLDRDADAGGLQGWLDFLTGGGARAGVVLGFSESREFKNYTAQDAATFALSQSETHWTDDVYRVYRATLDRDPDLGGFTGWIEDLGSGTNYQTMVGGFTNSREFQNTYGALDDTAFVELLYQNVLDRGSDAGGLRGWLDFLAGGGTRAGVVEGFAQSGEFVRETANDLVTWVRAQGTDDVLEAGAGDNILSGGVLSDTFVFEAGAANTSRPFLADYFAELGRGPGNTRVVDFEAWDQIELRGFGYVTASDAQPYFAQRGADVVFDDQDVSAVFANADLDAVIQSLLI